MTTTAETSPAPPPASANSGGVQFIGEDGQPAKGAATSKSLAQLMSERAAREGKPLDVVKADMATPKPPELEPEVIHDPMAPLKAHEFDIGKTSRFAMSLPPEALEGGWNAEQEAQNRQWLEKAEANAGQLGAFTMAMTEIARADETAQARFIEKTGSWLQSEYGNRQGEALAAAKRVVDEVGGQKLRDYFLKTGMGNHPQVVKEFVHLAIRRGYFTK